MNRGRRHNIFALASVAVALCLIFPFWAHDVRADEQYRLVSAPFPPFIKVDKNKKIEGFVPLLIDEAMTRAGLKHSVEIHPWERALRMTEKGPLTFHMSLARTKHRENKFQWVYPLFQIETGFIHNSGKKSPPRMVKTETPICVLSRTTMLGHLKRKGYRRVLGMPDVRACVRLLRDGKVDYIFSEWFVTRHAFELEGMPVDKLRKGDAVLKVDVYLAASKDVEAHHVRNVKAAMREMTRDGTLETFLNRYNMKGLAVPK